MVLTEDSLQRFWKYVQRGEPDACWLWIGAKVSKGYGVLSINREHRYAHRISYELHYGAIPAGLFVCHSCDNPPCCNPAHLWAGTARDNTQDMYDKGRRGPRKPRISTHATLKLNPDMVRAIRAARATGETLRQIGRRHGVSHEAVRLVVSGQIWKYVD